MTEHLSSDEICALFARMDDRQLVEVTRIRYKNHEEIRRTGAMSFGELRDLVLATHEDGHLPGGDLTVPLDSTRTLIGHHDGIYWIEESNATARTCSP